MNTASIPKLLRAEDVAEALGTSRQTVYSLAQGGLLRSVVFKTSGNRSTYRFRAEDVQAFIVSNLREGRGAR